MIGKYLKKIREDKGITIRELGNKMGKTPPQYSRIENEKVLPNDDTILDILVRGFDMPYSEAKDMISQWRVEDALEKASDPSKVINSIVAGNNSIVINGSNNTISK